MHLNKGLPPVGLTVAVTNTREQVMVNMRKAKELVANHPLSKPQRPLNGDSTTEQGGRQGKRILRLWTRLTALYGHRWTSNYGPATDQEGNLTQAALTWVRATSDLSDEQIRHGLNQLVRTGEEWPPPLPRFRRLCIQTSDAPRTYLGRDWQELKAEYEAERQLKLPKSSSDGLTPAEHIRKMRETIKRQQPATTTEESKPHERNERQ